MNFRNNIVNWLQVLVDVERCCYWDKKVFQFLLKLVLVGLKVINININFKDCRFINLRVFLFMYK